MLNFFLQCFPILGKLLLIIILSAVIYIGNGILSFEAIAQEALPPAPAVEMKCNKFVGESSARCIYNPSTSRWFCRGVEISPDKFVESGDSNVPQVKEVVIENVVKNFQPCPEITSTPNVVINTYIPKRFLRCYMPNLFSGRNNADERFMEQLAIDLTTKGL